MELFHIGGGSTSRLRIISEARFAAAVIKLLSACERHRLPVNSEWPRIEACETQHLHHRLKICSVPLHHRKINCLYQEARGRMEVCGVAPLDVLGSCFEDSPCRRIGEDPVNPTNHQIV